MIVILDKYEDLDDLFLQTLERIDDIEGAYTMEDTPFLTKGVMSIYEHYLSGFEGKTLLQKDLYYAFVETPEFWQIKAEGGNGAIFDMGVKKANVYVRPPYEKRYVERVEWLNEAGCVYRIDYYNRYGYVYCRAYLDNNGAIESKSYYTSSNEEIININGNNGIVTLFEHGCVSNIFPSTKEFEEYVMHQIVVKSSKCVLTSKSQIERFAERKKEYNTSFLLAMRHEEDVTYCQRNQIQNLLKTKLLIFSNSETKMCQADENYGAYGVCYAPKKTPKTNKCFDALVLTTSDQLFGIEKLVVQLPMMNFHIAANTLVSQRLIDLSINKNVFIYPQVTEEKREELFGNCGFYFDINNGRELYNAVIRASVNDMLIIGCLNVLHNPAYVIEECLFRQNEPEEIITKIKAILQDVGERERLVQKQRKQREAFIEAIMG